MQRLNCYKIASAVQKLTRFVSTSFQKQQVGGLNLATVGCFIRKMKPKQNFYQLKWLFDL